MSAVLSVPLHRRLLAILAAGAIAATALAATPLAQRAIAQDDEMCELGGDLNFIGWADEDGPEVAKPFLEEHGITVNPTYVVSAEDPLTTFKTGGRGQMDIIAYNKDFGNSVMNDGEELFQPLDLSRIPNAEGLFPALKTADWVQRDGVTFGIPLIWGDEPLIYDPEVWSEEDMPAKYTGFSDPKFEGHLSMLDDGVANLWLWSRSLGHPEPARLTQEQLDEVVEVMLETKPNVVEFSPGFAPQADSLVRGETTIAIGGWAAQVEMGRAQGKELAIALPEEDGTYFWSDIYAIAVDAPNECNAYAFINYMMEPENNAAIASALGSAVTIADAVQHLDEATAALYDYSIPDDPESILRTQVVFPPAQDEGDIVGLDAWNQAWQEFKLR